MKKLATIIATATLAACLAFTGTAYAGEQTLPHTAGSSEEGAVTPVALYMANDYTIFTRAMEDVIGRNATTVQATLGQDGARTAISGLLQAGADNDAAAVEAPAGEAYVSEDASVGMGSATYAAASASATGPCTLTMQGQTIPYVDSYRSARAPESGAGLWYGSDSTTDGSYGYFIGHNPGAFGCMLGMGIGSQVTVTDGNGDSRTYTVCDVFDVASTATWKSIESRVTGHGESIMLQCCIQDGSSYRIMVAA